MAPASGFSPLVSLRKNEATSRIAANPSPRTVGVFCRINQLVDVVGIESSVETDLRRARRSGKRRRRTIGKGPLIVGDQLARVILMHALGQDRTRVTETDRLVACRRCPGIRTAA